MTYIFNNKDLLRAITLILGISNYINKDPKVTNKIAVIEAF